MGVLNQWSMDFLGVHGRASGKENWSIGYDTYAEYRLHFLLTDCQHVHISVSVMVGSPAHVGN